MERNAKEIIKEIDTKLLFFMDMLKKPVKPEELIIYMGNNDYEIMGDFAEEYFLFQMMKDPNITQCCFNSYKGICIEIAPNLQDIQIGIRLLMPDRLIEEPD